MSAAFLVFVFWTLTRKGITEHRVHGVDRFGNAEISILFCLLSFQPTLE